jgi:hypothetical protein
MIDSIFVDVDSGEVRATWVSPCGTHYRVRWPRLTPRETARLRDALRRGAAEARTLDELVERAPVSPLVVQTRGGPICRHCRSATCPPRE